MSTRPWLDNLVFAELVDLACVKTKPFAQNFICVLSKQRRRLDVRRAPAESHRPARHLVRAGDRVLHRLHDSALLEVCVLGQLHRVEDGACGHAGAAEHAHRLALFVLTRPGGDHRIDLGLVLKARRCGFEARIADQILASDHFEQPLPMHWIGAAGIDIEVVVRTARLTRIDAARHREAGDHLGAIALECCVKVSRSAQPGITPDLHEQLTMKKFEPGRATVAGRVLLECKAVHIHDVRSDPEYPMSPEAEMSGVRTALGVPLLRESTPIGMFVVMRRKVQPFTERQIELLSTFADQAVIAIENTRLFEAEQQRTRELSESLEQQTATSEVLQVISSSPGDVDPVFTTMLEKAVRICDAMFGGIWR